MYETSTVIEKNVSCRGIPVPIIFSHPIQNTIRTALTVWFGKGTAPVPSFNILYFIPLSVVVKSAKGSSSANTGATPETRAVTETPAAAPTKDRRSTDDFEADDEDLDDDDMESEKAVAAVPATANRTNARVMFIFWVLDRRKGLDMPTMGKPILVGGGG